MNFVIVVVVRNIKNVVWGNKMDGPVDLNKKREERKKKFEEDW